MKKISLLSSLNRNKFYVLILLTLGLFVGCSGGEGSESMPVSINLSVDKTTFAADGKEEVTFSVQDDKGKEVTESCKFRIAQSEQTSPVFKTDRPGTYKVVAIYATLTSNEVSVVAFDQNAEVTIKLDKTEVMADGKDMVCLTLSDELDNDVSEFGEFYVNGAKLEGRYFKTTTTRKYQITAKWNSRPVEGTEEITAYADLAFTGRVLVESMVSTSCVYCQSTIVKLTDIAKKNSQVVLISTHVAGSMYENADSEAKKDAKDLQKKFDSSVTPSVFLNHDKNLYWSVGFQTENDILTQVTNPAEVAIAIENEVSDNELTVSATIASKRSFTGKAVAVLVENGIRAIQAGMGTIEMYRMMRDYVPDVTGKSITLTAGTTTPFSVKIPLHDYKQQNCWVIVFVVGENGRVCGIQHTPLNRNIGY